MSDLILIFCAVCLLCVYRSMQKLTQLERLDLGSNEFTEVVSICRGPGALLPFWGDLVSSLLICSLFFPVILKWKLGFQGPRITFITNR